MLARIGAALAAVMCALPAARAQTVTWKTNYYNVTGANQQEVRDSMRRARPWRDNFDAITEWNVRWKFATRPSANGCDCENLSTVTTITMTLPRWFMPTNTNTTVRGWWFDFHKKLTEHEVGHAQIGISAGSEVLRQLQQVGSQGDCGTLRQRINSTAQRVVEEHRERDREYDRRTGHGRF